MTKSIMEKFVLVKAPVSEVWRAWTTVEGVKRFFAPDARLDIRPGGRYEVLFDLDAPPGKQGSELCAVLSYVPNRMLSFSWNAPPQFEKSRAELAQWVVLLFDQESQSETRVTFLELGWKDGEEGEKVYEYFDKAWETVLARLAYSFEHGPIDWGAPWRPAR